MKPSEIRDKNDEELRELDKELRDQLVKLSVGRVTQRTRNTAQFSRIRKDIARVATVLREREMGIRTSTTTTTTEASSDG